MTTEIKSWGSSQGGNNISGALFPEQLAPNQTTDNLREQQAAIRRQWNEAEWFVIGDLSGPATFSFISATQFRVEGISLESRYHIGRRVRATGSSTGIIYGSITATDGAPSGTTVTVQWDSGSLQNESLEIALAAMSAVNSSHPAVVNHSVNFAAGASFGGDVSFLAGPFTLVGITKAESGAVAIPSTTRKLIINGYGGGGGGSRSGQGAFGDDPDTDPTADGADLTVTGTGFSLTAGGGGGGGGQVTGQGVGAVSSSSVTGANFNWTATGFGSKAGKGGMYAHDGNDGDFVQAVVLNPTFTSVTVAGGAGGIGFTGSGNGNGSNGNNGFAVFFFFE